MDKESDLSLIPVAVIKDSVNMELGKNKVYLDYTCRPQTNLRALGQELIVELLAIPPNIT